MTDGPGVLNPVTIIANGVPVSDSNPLPTASGASGDVNISDIGGQAVGQSNPLFVSQPGFSFRNISTATTTTVKSGAGVLHLVNVNSKGTIASVVTVYDNTAGSGTIIAIIDSLNLAGPNFYDIAFATGCTLVTTGTVAPNITVAYR